MRSTVHRMTRCLCCYRQMILLEGEEQFCSLDCHDRMLAAHNKLMADLDSLFKEGGKDAKCQGSQRGRR